MSRACKGTIDLDIRKSRPDWEPFLAPKAPNGSPNVLIILYDDTGLAAWFHMGASRERWPLAMGFD
jgi:arylsulfatase